jgi:hypothetical protein
MSSIVLKEARWIYDGLKLEIYNSLLNQLSQDGKAIHKILRRQFASVGFLFLSHVKEFLGGSKGARIT